MGDKSPSGGASGAGRKKSGADSPVKPAKPQSTQERLDTDTMSLAERNKAYRRVQLAEEKAYLQNLYLSQKLTPEAMASLGDYKQSGYGPVNKYLRDGDTNNIYVSNTTSAANIKNLDSAILQLPEAITLYRGFSNQGEKSAAVIQKFIIAHNNGTIKNTIFEDAGYGSSSVDKDKAFGGEVTFQIRAAKGSKVLVPDRLGNLGSEREIIVNRGAKYRIINSVIKTYYGQKKLELEVELIQD